MNVSEDLHKQKKKEAAQTELKYKVLLEELKKRHHDKLHKIECKLAEAEITIQEFMRFVTVCTFTNYYHLYTIMYTVQYRI